MDPFELINNQKSELVRTLHNQLSGSSQEKEKAINFITHEVIPSVSSVNSSSVSKFSKDQSLSTLKDIVDEVRPPTKSEMEEGADFDYGIFLYLVSKVMGS